jgi:hypothetical protein
MTPAEIALALQTLEWLAGAIPKWISQAKARGELSETEEAEFQRRQKDVFSQPYAKPDV